MLGFVQKDISLSDSSSLSHNGNDTDRFACEKAFEIMQLIDQQISKNDQKIKGSGIVASKGKSEPKSLSSGATNESKNH
jgi:hypothetical protein